MRTEWPGREQSGQDCVWRGDGHSKLGRVEALGATPVLVFTREAVLGVCSQFWQPDGDYKDGCPFGLHRACAL